MSIPEATQLVLQASAMADAGEVFVLDMGEPVKIDDLARNMIRLSGMSLRDGDNPAGDIEIQYVGLRPGEKLHEELFVGEGIMPTAHPRIHMAKERFLAQGELELHLQGLKDAIAARDVSAVRQKLHELIGPEKHNIEADEVVTPLIRFETHG
jgi:FlaA1/EpsC-like NDP-sugar epimerase